MRVLYHSARKLREPQQPQRNRDSRDSATVESLICDSMTDDIDFRSDPMESPEGRGIALSRLHRWQDTIPEDAYEDVARAEADLEDGGYYEPRYCEDENGEWQLEQGLSALEEADLIGFWIAWHRAGGFSALERSGWHRATIYRKVKAFRLQFGQHPDAYEFDWIKLDLKKCWNDKFYKPLDIVREAAARSAAEATTRPRSRSKRVTGSPKKTATSPTPRAKRRRTA